MVRDRAVICSASDVTGLVFGAYDVTFRAGLMIASFDARLSNYRLLYLREIMRAFHDKLSIVSCLWATPR